VGNPINIPLSNYTNLHTEVTLRSSVYGTHTQHIALSILDKKTIVTNSWLQHNLNSPSIENKGYGVDVHLTKMHNVHHVYMVNIHIKEQGFYCCSSS